MPTTMYGPAKQALAEAKIDWENDTWRVYLIDADEYTPDFDADEFLDDVPGEALVAYEELTGMTNVLGVLDADNPIFTAPSGAECENLLIVQWGTEAADSRLFLWLDDVGGMPITPGGTDIGVTWDDGANKITAI